MSDQQGVSRGAEAANLSSDTPAKRPAVKSAAADPAFIEALPKCELHLHIEGSLEPATMLAIAQRNGIEKEVCKEGEDAAAAIRRITKEREDFKDLCDFLRLYNGASTVLRKKRDFYDLMTAYIARCKEDNVRYAEVFFDPQSHMQRGVEMGEMIDGLYDALQTEGACGKPEGCAAADRPFSGRLILSFLRDWKVTDDDDRLPAGGKLSPFDGFPSATAALDAARPHVGKLIAVGLDNAEMGSPPALFAPVFAAAREAGIPHAVAHAGEEGPPDPYVIGALDALKVERLDHGVLTLKDEALTKRVAEARTPLTVCPNSNDLLKVYDRFFDGRRDVVRQLMDAGLNVTLNSDDPAYFGGYMTANFTKAAKDSALTKQELVQLSRNAFAASFATAEEKKRWAAELDEFAAEHCSA